MTELQKQWFDALTKDRDESAKTLEKPSMRGVQRSVVDKYSDQAHFIYELLQNADDAQATMANFILKKDGLVFIHNGMIRFSITNPAAEGEDTESGNLGHINSITSIANSNKTEATIGKFGVGFKAVFQYTQTPHVYDPEVWFKIERFIVPQLLKTDFAERKADETIFWFPFDHEEKTAEFAYSDISEILKSLVSPTLFLSNINNILYQTLDLEGKYLKKIEDTIEYGNIKSQFISLLKTTNETTDEQKLWLFSRTIDKTKHSYCVGFYMENNKLIPVQQPAFCFFPTRENTKLKFIIHAPFILTDSREGIKAGDGWNISLVQRLAELAADSLLLLRGKNLIDDNIINIIPYAESDFLPVGDKRSISFKPFYTEIKEKFNTETLLPVANGNYTSKMNAYWFQDKRIIEIFSDEQLRQLIGNPKAEWVFRGLARNQFDTDKIKRAYLDDCVVNHFEMTDLLQKIDTEFIKEQAKDPEYKWLHNFYEYLNNYQDRAKIVRNRPIFLDQEGNAVPAYDHNDELILFLPDDTISGYPTVKKELLANDTTREFIEKKFEIKKPNLYNEIYNKILPLYKSNDAIDTIPHFKLFFKYYKNCNTEELIKFIDKIKAEAFIKYKSDDDERIFRGRASDIYYPTKDLQTWFESKSNTKFLFLEKYHEIIDAKEHEQLDDFLKQLGISDLPKVFRVEISMEDAIRISAPKDYSTAHRKWYDKYIDGCENLLNEIDTSKSILLWNILLQVQERYASALYGKYEYFYRYPQSKPFDSSEIIRLRTKKWILNKENELVSASAVTVQALSSDYDTSSPNALALIKFLGIRDEMENTANLSEEQINRINLGKIVEEFIKETGFSVDEVKKKLEKLKVQEPDTSNGTGNNGNERTTGEASGPKSPSASTGSKVLDSIIELIKKPNEEKPEDEDEDEDENTPRSVDYLKKIKREEYRSSSKLSNLNHAQELVDIIRSSEKYSFIWFKSLLELEGMENLDNESGSKRISISFGKVEKEPGTEKTIVLKHPTPYISAKIEELSNIRLDIDTKNGKCHIEIESVSINGYTLKARLKSIDEIKNMNLEDILQARIDVQSPDFLMKTLQQCFGALPLEDKYNLRDKLPENIEFIFGPPGTGKTTYLATKVLRSRMNSENLKILVLTPTNKAADVLTTRIMTSMGTDKSYKNWLIRFGTTNDENIETEEILQTHSFNISSLDKVVVVSTIARFTYDGFSESDGIKKLYELNWDYIVFDEASMIHLPNIIYPIFRTKPKKFIIAGDPFQIGPIASIKNWKDENIYTMVMLDKFVDPTPIPHDFKITNLATQYRSVPAIGQVFSNFMYDGILEHKRSKESGSTLKIPGMNIRPINIIRFPVSSYESIFRTQKLSSGSSYQSYSALFTFEFVKYLSNYIKKEEACADVYKIGIISPYRAQADLIDKLIASWHHFPAHVDVNSNTIHGFQGDECDIIIAVFNPPPNISENIFLNRKNILNVSISRAKDYLFILMPDDNTENIENLKGVRKIERLVKETGEYSEIDSTKIEELIFGDSHYLEENTFSTSHQSVNVYGKPEKKYEVRSEDIAVDVQTSDAEK
ncbi:MAG: AAA family ATPase [Prevotellaceae bacterium]|jgi:hypothetical protein|nr:AAA family ATPase [Prevotellaceae bacterium]